MPAIWIVDKLKLAIFAIVIIFVINPVDSSVIVIFVAANVVTALQVRFKDGVVPML
jgi:hypothetical protein